jgi:hypothetical protein
MSVFAGISCRKSVCSDKKTSWSHQGRRYQWDGAVTDRFPGSEGFGIRRLLEKGAKNSNPSLEIPVFSRKIYFERPLLFFKKN